MSFMPNDKVIALMDAPFDNLFSIQGEVVREGRTYCVQSVWQPNPPMKGEGLILVGSTLINRKTGTNQGWPACSFRLTRRDPPDQVRPSHLI